MDKNSPCAIKTKKKMAGALKALMQTNAFDKITVSDITDECQIHRQTFYYHFQDRYELLDWLIYHELIEPFVSDFTFDNMYDKFRELLTTIYNDKRFYQNALKINSVDLSNYLSRITKCQFTGLIKGLNKDGDIAPQSEEADLLIAEFFGFGLSGVVLNWALGGMKETPEYMTRNIENLVEICKQVSLQRK